MTSTHKNKTHEKKYRSWADDDDDDLPPVSVLMNTVHEKKMLNKNKDDTSRITETTTTVNKSDNEHVCIASDGYTDMVPDR